MKSGNSNMSPVFFLLRLNFVNWKIIEAGGIKKDSIMCHEEYPTKGLNIIDGFSEEKKKLKIEHISVKGVKTPGI